MKKWLLLFALTSFTFSLEGAVFAKGMQEHPVTKSDLEKLGRHLEKHTDQELKGLRRDANKNSAAIEREIRKLGDASKQQEAELKADLEKKLQKAEADRRADEARKATVEKRRALFFGSLLACGIAFGLASLLLLRRIFRKNHEERGVAGNVISFSQSASPSNDLTLRPGATLQEIEELAKRTGKNNFPYSEPLEMEQQTVQGRVERDRATGEWKFIFGSHRVNAKRRKQAAAEYFREQGTAAS